MSMSAPLLAALMQTELEKTGVDPADAALWSTLFDSLAEAIVAHLTDNVEVVASGGTPNGETIQ